MSNRTSKSLHLILAEWFFASLPAGIILLAYVLLRPSHANSFLQYPDISLVSCVLSGLTITSIIKSANGSGKGGAKGKSYAYVTLAIMPIIVLILSVATIFGAVIGSYGTIFAFWQLFIFVLSSVIFVILGGFSIWNTEEGD